MSVDVLTLYQLNFTVGIVMAGICFFSWLHQRDTLGLRGWSTALLLGSLGTLELSLRTKTSPIPLVVMANSLVIAAYASVWMSIRRFNSGERGIRYATVPTGLFFLLFSAVLAAGVEVNVRVAICSVAIAILSLLAGRDVFRGGIAEPLRSRLPTGLALLFMAFAMVVRMVFSLLEAPPEGEATPFYDPTQGITLLVNTICVVAMTLGFLMMANERLKHHYEKLASTDELTGLPNRRFLLDRGARAEEPACVLMIDLDRFSEINRCFGHAGGDQALVAFALLARQQLRPTDMIARYGGEEFCAVLSKVEESEALQVAERLRAALADLSIEVERRSLRITTSIGVAELNGNLAAAIRKADAALYRAKALGRNQVCGARELSAGVEPQVGTMSRSAG